MSFPLFLVSLFTLVELNCENLFDFRHDNLKEDIEFTPDGSRRWTERKYWNKLNNISKEILACGIDGDDWRLPDFVALCEVENDSVMRDLTKRSLLRNANYEYVITDSPDIRGIDVALLYSPGRFSPIVHYPLRVEPVAGMRPTRDILYVSGRIVTGDTLHLFVVHAPSKYGGDKATRPHRMAVADRLCMAIDSLREACTDPNIIITGDFNDHADSQPVTILKDYGMENISSEAKGSNGAEATYKYKGEWSNVDHILVCGKLSGWLLSCRVTMPRSFLRQTTNTAGCSPSAHTVHGNTATPTAIICLSSRVSDFPKRQLFYEKYLFFVPVIQNLYENRQPTQALREAAFCIAKGYLLASERPPFRSQKTAFYNALNIRLFYRCASLLPKRGW